MTTIPPITDLPTPPQTSDPTNFDTRADAFLAALDSPFVTEVNAFATAANTVAGEVSTNATNAASSASAASTSASSASTSASTATTQATNASSSATAAASSATAAATSATNAATSAGALSANANSYRTVDYVATSNVDISTALANGQTLDGGTLATGQRVLLTAQSTASQNGIYDVPASGAASRSADSNSAVLMPSGIEVAVTRGTAGAGSSYVHTTAPGYTLDTTALTFSRRNLFANLADTVPPTNVAYASGNYTANGSMTWTVDSGDQQTLKYAIAGKMMTVWFTIGPTTVGGTLNSILQIKIPASKTCSDLVIQSTYVNDNGTTQLGVIQIAAGGSNIQILKADGTNWSSATNATSVYGTFTFPIN